MTKKMNEEYNSLIYDIETNDKFNRLKKELHHGISRYEHSSRVAKWTYKICKLFKLKTINETTRAALLHDFYIDEELNGQSSVKKLNTHPDMALYNSLQYYKLNEIQQDIISKHMFPCTTKLPKYKETWLVSGVDKAVGLYEMIRFKFSLYAGIYLLFIFEIITIQR